MASSMAGSAAQQGGWSCGAGAPHGVPPHAVPTTIDEPVWVDQTAAALGVAPHDVHCFATLMAQAGHAVDLPRFFCDMAYAFRQLALAHCDTGPQVRASALALFEPCQRLLERRNNLARLAHVH